MRLIVKIALAQLNPTVGAIRSNADLALAAVEEALQKGAQLVVTPELLISGYPPKDLLLRESFVVECDRVVDELARRLPPEIGLLLGEDEVEGSLASWDSCSFCFFLASSSTPSPHS